MDGKSRLFWCSVQDTTHEAIDEFFTEENFREILGYDDEMFDEMADELDMDVIDWDRVQLLAHDVLTDWQADQLSKAAAVMGRKGGKVSSPAKSAAAKQRPNPGLAEGRKKLASLSPEQRRENAKKAAAARWGKK